MNIIFDNIVWMSFNVLLALLGLVLGIAFIYAKNKFLKIIIFILWMLYLPNTIYLITDTQHFSEHWLELNLILQLIMIIQYIILVFIGVATFILSFYLLDKCLCQSRIKNNKTLIIILLLLTNYLVAFGVALGRINRLNSIEAITHPIKVIENSLSLISSTEVILTVFVFGTLTNFLYFFLRKKIKIEM
ncbi:MAG: DUF1361 domain-containing protein [Candidatus Daviesbacteria bacterium]|nr:DUF1361 domain-containing protein [Candidatus Daviesbacteria bacterium]